MDKDAEAIKKMEIYTRMRGFTMAFDKAVEDGTLETYSKAVKKWYDIMRKAGFNDDQTIRIISHSFTRMLSEDE